MKPEEIRKKIKDNQPKKLKEQLKRIASGEEKANISKETAEFGLLFFKGDKAYYSWSPKMVSVNDKRHKELQKHDIQNLWKGEHKDFISFIFGSELTPHIIKAWNNIPKFMYQSGYYRRSFRRPNDKKTTEILQINFLIGLIFRETPNFAFSLHESIKYNNSISSYQSPIEKVWAAAIDSEDNQVFDLMKAIIIGDAEAGTISRKIIKALLCSEKKEAWELIGNLLLSAQRQEGLRQTILEALDETSEGAFQYILDLIIEHKLIRFSSVVRSLDTWTGLGWEAEKQSTTKRFMELAQKYYKKPELLEKSIKEKDNAEVYMALWGQGAHDIDQCYPYLKWLYENGTIEKKTLVLYFVNETGIKEWYPEFGRLALYEEQSVLQYWGHKFLSILTNPNDEYYDVDNLDKNKLFEKMFNLYENFDKKEIRFEGKVFSWLTFVYHKYELGNTIINLVSKKDEVKMQRLLATYPEMPIENREHMVRKILSSYTGYYGNDNNVKHKEPTDKQRDFALSILRDRSEYVRNTAMRALSSAKLNEEEIKIFEDLLTRKSAGFRKFVLKMIQKRPVEEIFGSTERLVVAKNVEQRLAGLDLLTYLYKDDANENRVKSNAKIYSERKKIGKKEQILLDVLLAEKTIEYNAENGFGLYDVNTKTSLKQIKKQISGEYFERSNVKHPFGFSKPIQEIEKDLNTLKKLFVANEDYEYEIEYWDNSRDKVLLGNRFDTKKHNTEGMNSREKFENYPLWEVWEEWYKKSKLTPFDLFLISFADNANSNSRNKNFFPLTREKAEHLIPKIKLFRLRGEGGHITSRGTTIIQLLSNLYSYEKEHEYFIGLQEEAIALIDSTELNITKEKKGYWKEHITVFDTALDPIINRYLSQKVNDKLFPRVWNINQFVYQNTPKKSEYKHIPELKDYCRAYQLNLCKKDELIGKIMSNKKDLQTLTYNVEKVKNWRSKETIELYEKYDFLPEIVEKVKARILEIELKRGDSETSVTELADGIQTILGIDYLIEILNALGKDTLSRGYYYGTSKKNILSSFLSVCYPSEKNTQEEFNQKIKKAEFTEKRLIEIGLYAQQWLPFITEHLGWKGLESGAWWLHAHTNDDDSAEKETEVARYSEIPMTRFKDGAVDYSWFLSAYQELGKKRWKLLYDSAKYISDGTGHTRAKLYSDVITGDVKIREITKRVKDKRNKDYVRVYGLVPLSKTIPEKDLLNRYNYLLQFKKECKQFGAQRQASESLAVEIALENLARTAGYPDPIRLTWAMETEEAKTIINNAEILKFDDYTIELIVDELGKAHLISKRGDKELKTLPAKLRKEKSVEELKDFHKRLKNQYSRSRKSLEEAMVRGDEFQAEEIENLSKHPVISPMLSALALISDGKIGFYKAGKLVDEKNDSFDLGESIRIAHCTDFYKKDNWTTLQSFCFENEIVQPFKQIFRELYIPTADELQEKSISRRYAGHQIQPKKTVALLKTRGWTVDYEEGLQRVYHKEGLIAKMYAMADWFSPADTESPTLETVEFFNRKDGKKIAFEDLNPLIFSEVMRDVDLVVSVAHVGGVDPEASHSTVEMRGAIIRETSKLFKLNNVSIEGHHAHIKGHFGEYSVHLGSAVTHMKPGKYLSILPIHSQHRGRLFLPFVDDDPRSAELMSKILLLAKDKEIKDPTVLEQIQ